MRTVASRSLISAVLVPLYLLGAVHMAFVTHTLDASGAVVELHDGDTAHAHAGASFCDPSEEGWSTPDSCLAVSWSKAPFSLVRTPVLLAPRAGLADLALAPPRRAFAGLDVLCVAPKGSPPAA